MFKYQVENTLEKRREAFSQISSKCPDKLPIIIEHKPAANYPKFQISRMLCPAEFTMQQFVSLVRRRTKLPKENALFAMANGKDLIAGGSLMVKEYRKHKSKDGFLYILFSDHEAMG